MPSTVIWAVLYSIPKEARQRGLSLRPLVNERFRVGADMMYIRRFGQAMRLAKGDRVVINFGGPSGSDRHAGYIIQAGCVKEVARHLREQDRQDFALLLKLTCEMFPHFQTEPGLFERQGIIRYDLFNPPPDVQPLPRPFPPPMPGMNFIPLLPGDPEYSQLDRWWNAVVLRGQCGKE
jgi:hypothetical protein